MAETSAGKERVLVHGYERDDGTKVPTHYRTPPRPAPELPQRPAPGLPKRPTPERK
jgi:hypothetical protein